MRLLSERVRKLTN